MSRDSRRPGVVLIGAAILVFGGLSAVGIRALMRLRQRAEAPAALPAGLCDVTVRLDARGVSVNGALLQSLESIEADGGLDPIEPLQTELHARGRHCLVMESEKRVPFRVLTAVMSTARNAGYSDVRLGVLGP